MLSLSVAEAAKQSFRVGNPVYRFGAECLRICNLELHQMLEESLFVTLIKPLNSYLEQRDCFVASPHVVAGFDFVPAP
jgi:hypothetical protein